MTPNPAEQDIKWKNVEQQAEIVSCTRKIMENHLILAYFPVYRG